MIGVLGSLCLQKAFAFFLNSKQVLVGRAYDLGDHQFPAYSVTDSAPLPCHCVEFLYTYKLYPLAWNEVAGISRHDGIHTSSAHVSAALS